MTEINEEYIQERMQEIGKNGGEFTTEELVYCLKQIRDHTITILKGVKGTFEDMEIVRTGIVGTEKLYNQIIERVGA